VRHTAILSLLCGLFKPLGEVSPRRGQSGVTNCRVGAPQQDRAKERGAGGVAVKEVLDNSLFVRLVSVRPNLEFRKGGSHDHWTDDAW